MNCVEFLIVMRKLYIGRIQMSIKDRGQGEGRIGRSILTP